MIGADDKSHDLHGNFPVLAPNGSSYSILLGNDMPGSEADQVAYNLVVPPDDDAYNIIFSYAIVLEDPSHAPHLQPRFTVKVFNVSRNQYIECSSFDFVAGYSQPDFQESQFQKSVFFKPWTSSTINLGQFRGEEVRIEFTVNDCAPGAHFGYAYLDILEKCTGSLTGNILCRGSNSTTLFAPSGFNEYRWYDNNFSTLLGDKASLHVSNPKVGDSISLVLIPASYLGCRDTIVTEFIRKADTIYFNIPDSVSGCMAEGFDLTSEKLVWGRSRNVSIDFFKDSIAATPILQPNKIFNPGRYFFRGVNDSGCVLQKPITVGIYPNPHFSVMQPAQVQFPGFVNLEKVPDDASLRYTYFSNKELTAMVATPNRVQTSGLYYIKGTNTYNCSSIMDVTVKVKPAVHFPTAFTPNNDGVNDEFRYIALGGLEQVEFSIFNRWGQIIFHSNTPGKGWNGLINGKHAEMGTYVWTLKATDWLGSPYSEKGTVLLLR